MCNTPRSKYGLDKRKKIAQKVAKYFPLKPRLQRLFMSKEIAKDIRWHQEKLLMMMSLSIQLMVRHGKSFDKEHD